MSYSSPIFLFGFLPLVLAAYLVTRGQTARNGLLLVASLAFYAWGEGIYAALLIVSIAMNHGFGLWLGSARGRPSARVGLVLAVAANLSMLGAFKYAGFLTDNANVLLGWLGGPALERPAIHLPIGLSFFTFQAMSYVLDVYARNSEPQKNPLRTALYIALFPQLILGPIVRYRHIAAELTRRVLTAEDFARGAGRFAIGLGKKVLIADTIAIAVDRVYALPAGEVTPGLAWLGAAGFTLQLYFDFSGYSDMGIGLGRMFGFHFRENFNYPLFARSRSDFFRRWNISFFTWMRDYLFIPLCGRRCPYWREQANVLILFFLVGLWHGASWVYVLWGFGNGMVIVIERVWLLRHLQRLWRPLQHGYALLTTMGSLAFFRATSLEQAGSIYCAMAGLAPGGGAELRGPPILDGLTLLALAAGVLGMAPLLPAAWSALRGLAAERLAPRLAAWPAGAALPLGAAVLVPGALWYGGVLLASAMVVAARTYTPFVYFQF